MEDDKLQFGIGLTIDRKAWEDDWKKMEAEIQRTLDESQFKIKIKGMDELEGIKTKLKEIQEIQEKAFKPMTEYQAAKINISPQVAAAKEAVKWDKKSEETRARARKEAAKAEMAELKLAQAKEKGVSATNRQTSAYKRQLGVMNGMRQFLNSYISILGAYRLIKNIKDITSEFELQRVSLRAITQDVQFADQLFAKIKTTAIASPFSTKELITYTKQLAAYRVENENLYDTMNMLADVSAGLGISMDRLILAYGQVKAASVLRGQELRQFTEAGIPLVDQLAVKFSQLRGEVVSTGEVFELISARKVPFEMIAEIFKDMTKEGGRFYQMQRKQAESLYGVFENLKDNIQVAFDEIGRSQRGFFMGVGKGLTFLAQHLKTLTDLITPLIFSFGAYRVALALINGQNMGMARTTSLLAKAEYALAGAETDRSVATGLLVGTMRMARAANNKYAISIVKAASANNVFTRSLYKLQAAFYKNPVAIILGGMVGIIAGAINMWEKHIETLSSEEKAHERVAESMKKIQQPLDDATVKFNKFNDAIKEQETLLRSQKMSYEDFKKVYPDLFKKYDTEVKWKEAIANATDEQKKALKGLQEEFPGFFNNLEDEKDLLAGVAREWDNVKQGMQETQLEQAKMEKKKLETEIANLEKQMKDRENIALNPTRGGVGAFSFNTANQQDLARLKGLKAELADTTTEVEKLQKALDDIDSIISEGWRKEFKGQVLDINEMKDEEIAALSFVDAIKKVDEKLKEIEDKKKYLQNIPDKEKSNSKKEQEQLEELLKKEKEIKAFREKWQGIFTDPKAALKEAVSSLQTELSLVKEVYKRYEDLKKMMSDTKAEEKVKEIYGSLTNIDFLSVDEYKKRLEQLAREAEKLGKKDIAAKIRLEIQDIDLNEAKDKLERALDEISDQISKQKEAEDFFEKMMGLTNKTELSTQLTLAVTGIDVKSGEDIRGKLIDGLAQSITLGNEALDTPINIDISAENIAEGGEIINQIRDLIGKLKETGRVDLADTLQRSLKAYTDYSKKVLLGMQNTLAESGDIEAQRANIIAEAQNKINDLRQGLEEERPKLDSKTFIEEVKRVNAAVASITSWKDLELYKLSDNYIRFFTNISSFSIDEASKMRNEIKAALYDAFKNGAIDATELRKEIKTLDTQFKKLTETISFFSSFSQGGFQGLAEAFSQYGEDISDIGINLMNTSVGDITKATKDSITDALSQMKPTLEDGTVIDSFDSLFEAFGGDTEQMGNFLEKAGSDLIAGAQSFMGAISIVDMIIKNVASTIDGIQSIIDQLNEYRSEENKIGDGFRYLSDFNKYAASGWEKLKSGDVPGAVTDTVQSIISIFNNVQRRRIKKADEEIKSREKSLKRLENAMEDLDRAQRDLVGSDWIANQSKQIDKLKQQIADYDAQIKAERSKGKAADEDVIDELKEKKLAAEREVADKKREISEEMLGTDIASAAKDFAQAWVEAYMSFANTADAMKDKFKETMKSFVVNSMLAKLVENRLQNVFDAIEKDWQDDNEYDESEVKEIAELLDNAMKLIDQDLTTFSDAMNLRELLGEEDTSGLTGIAKGVAQASEETVLTLAGYANSILYNQVFLKNDVAAIRAMMEGGNVPKTTSAGGTPEEGINNGQLLQLQQASVAHLQAISNNTLRSAESLERVEDKLDSIISVPGSTSRKTINATLR